MQRFLLPFICVLFVISCVTTPSPKAPDSVGAGSSQIGDSGKKETVKEPDILPEVFQEWFGIGMGQNIARVFPVLVKTVSPGGSMLEETSGEGNASYLSRGIFPPVPGREEIELESLGMKLLRRTEFYGRLARPDTLIVVVLETEELNSFSSGNGIILVTRGLLDCAKDEAQRAAILAHEIAHHMAGDPLAPVDENALAACFGGVIPAEGDFTRALDSDPDIRKKANEMLLASLFLVMDSGYGEDAECEADNNAVTILEKGGYKRSAYTGLLQNIQAAYTPQRPDMATTHPSPEVRLANLGNR
jgi:hypothetical protein